LLVPSCGFAVEKSSNDGDLALRLVATSDIFAKAFKTALSL
jgi:hypothetical protein